jgi:hypothetical protein
MTFADKHTIQFLYFDGCPSWKTGLKNLKEALTRSGLQIDVQIVKVETPQDAQEYRFLGSPSFVMDGSDLWPEERESYYLGCRIYQTPKGLIGYPTIEMLQEKIDGFVYANQETN